MSDDSRPDPYSFPGAPGQRGLEVTRDEWRGEIDDGAFERAYQRMMFRRNQEAFRREVDPVTAPARLVELVPNPFAEEGS